MLHFQPLSSTLLPPVIAPGSLVLKGTAGAAEWETHERGHKVPGYCLVCLRGGLRRRIKGVREVYWGVARISPLVSVAPARGLRGTCETLCGGLREISGVLCVLFRGFSAGFSAGFSVGFSGCFCGNFSGENHRELASIFDRKWSLNSVEGVRKISSPFP